MPTIQIVNIDDGFGVFMFDSNFWTGGGHCVRFNCSRSELQGGVKKAIKLFKEKPDGT